MKKVVPTKKGSKEEREAFEKKFRAQEVKEDAEFNEHRRQLAGRMSDLERLSQTPVPESFDGRGNMVEEADAAVDAVFAQLAREQ